MVMLIMLMIAAFATDVGAWYRQGQEQQRSADLGSLNGIQTYEQSRKAEFSLAGFDEWSDFTQAERIAIDRQALIDATDEVIGVLEAAGHTVTRTPTNPDLAGADNKDPYPGGPTTPAQISVITFVTDDGKTVTVTRTEDRTISVAVAEPATQYFSSIVAAAPVITRESTATLSNCGAVCEVPITINPPFVGFSGSGSGDGFRPLIYRAQDEVWAVNHHRRKGDTRGEIVCMDQNTRTFCASGGLFSLDRYATHNRPAEEYLDESTGKIYFTAREWKKDETRLVCFSAVTRSYCGFRTLWDQDVDNRWPAIVNATGPWVYGNKMYVMGQHGQLACVDFAMNECGRWNTDAFGNSAMPEINDGQTTFVNGEMYGDRIYFTHILGDRTLFHCWDLGSANTCGWAGEVSINYLTGRDDQRMTFFRYSGGPGSVPTHICVASLQIGRNGCVSLNGASVYEVPGLSTHIAPLNNSWAGDTISWEGQRTFFAGGNSNKTACWNWATGAGCGILDHSTMNRDNNGVYQGPTDPYAFTQVSVNCMMGLGDKSVYFSFNPADLAPCVDAASTTEILPCKCGDGSNKWGVVFLPQELLDLVTSLRATVTEPDGTVVLLNEDLLATGGAMDLSSANQAAPKLTLTLVMDAKVNPSTQLPLWTNPFNIDLELVVQPTLVD